MGRQQELLALAVIVMAGFVIVSLSTSSSSGAAESSARLAARQRELAIAKHEEEIVSIQELRKELSMLTLKSERNVVSSMKKLSAKLDRLEKATAAAVEKAAAAVEKAAEAAAAQQQQQSTPHPVIIQASADQSRLNSGANRGFPSGLQACKRNAYISAWGDGDYEKAATAVRDFRTSLIKKGHRSHWDVSDHARFGMNPDVQTCGPMVRLGEGDGGKWTCNLPSLQPGCVIYSVGSDYNVQWEIDILNVTPCEVFTFDCTVLPSDDRYKVYDNLPPRLHFHRYCLGEAGPNTNDEMRPRFRTLASITQEFGHSNIALLKMVRLAL